MMKNKINPSKIANFIATSERDEVLDLGGFSINKKERKRFIHLIKASKHLQWSHNSCTTHKGVSVKGFAFWNGVQPIETKVGVMRFALLVIYRNANECQLYAIPMGKMGKHQKFPNIELSSDEIAAYRFIADSISDPLQEAPMLKLTHPAKKDICSNRDSWQDRMNGEDLLVLLEKHRWLLGAICCTLDVQLRSFRKLSEAPLAIYNFTMTTGDVQANANLRDALSAMNFSAAPSYMGARVPEIYLRNRADLEDWRRYCDRLVLICTATGSLLSPLLGEIDERERIRYNGGILPPCLPTVPVVQCRTIFCRNWVADIIIPPNEPRLTSMDLDTLRSAVATVINRKFAQAIYDGWRRQMASPQAYRYDAFESWRNEIILKFFYALFADNNELLAKALELLEDERMVMEKEREAREDTIKRALNLIADHSRYEREIVDRPTSKDEAKRLLDIEKTAVAFRFCPTKGKNTKDHFLAFTRISLQRLLAREGCGAELLDAVLDAAEKSELLDQRRRTIKLGKETMTFITFCT